MAFWLLLVREINERFGQSLGAIFRSSFDCHVLVGERAEPDWQRAPSVVTTHGHGLYWRFEFLPLLVATWLAPDFQPWITSTNLNKSASAISRCLLPVRWRHLCLHVWATYKPGRKRFGGFLVSFLTSRKIMLRKLKVCTRLDRLLRGSTGTKFLNKRLGSRSSLNRLELWSKGFSSPVQPSF